MISYKELIDRLKENEQIEKKFHEIETRILSVLNYKDFFEVLLTEIQMQFGVPRVWISLIDKSEVSDLVQCIEDSDILRPRISVVDRDLFMDLVNDTFGHDAGDELLKYLAALLLEMSRESDVAARFAGDEFVHILPETTAKSAEKMLKRLQNYLFDHPLVWGKNKIPFSISFGISSTEDKSIHSPDMLLKSADESLYQMKKEKS